MAYKQIVLPEIGHVTLYKRRSTTSIRLSVTPKGQVKVTMPYWVPYHAGAKFAESRREWISEHTSAASATLNPGQLVGKMHRLVFEASPVVAKVTSRVSESVIRVTYPTDLRSHDPAIQAAAAKASVRALRMQAEELLPARLRGLAMMHSFEFSSVQVKQLSGRWGSCDSNRNIVLNLFLMELPWTLIDYVLLHELTHTQVLRHGPDFWQAMKRVLPDVQVRRKAIKAYRPLVGGSPMI